MLSLLISRKQSTIEHMFYLLLWWQQRCNVVCITVSRIKTAKENSSTFK
jgi:hypothetical protein